jgi:hypothetical protein
MAFPWQRSHAGHDTAVTSRTVPNRIIPLLLHRRYHIPLTLVDSPVPDALLAPLSADWTLRARYRRLTLDRTVITT